MLNELPQGLIFGHPLQQSTISWSTSSSSSSSAPYIYFTACRTFLICRREEEGQSMEWQRKHSKVSGQEVFCHQDGTLAGGRGRQFAYSHFINALSYWFHFELYVVWRDTQSASHWSMWHSLGQRMSQQLEPAILNSDPTSLIGKQSEAVN